MLCMRARLNIENWWQTWFPPAHFPLGAGAHCHPRRHHVWHSCACCYHLRSRGKVAESFKQCDRSPFRSSRVKPLMMMTANMVGVHSRPNRPTKRSHPLAFRCAPASWSGCVNTVCDANAHRRRIDERDRAATALRLFFSLSCAPVRTNVVLATCILPPPSDTPALVPHE